MDQTTPETSKKWLIITIVIIVALVLAVIAWQALSRSGKDVSPTSTLATDSNATATPDVEGWSDVGGSVNKD